MCERNQAQTDKHQGLFDKKVSRGVRIIHRNSPMIMTPCLARVWYQASGMLCLTSRKKNSVGRKEQGQSNVTSSFGKTGIGPFFFLKSKLTRCGQMSTHRKEKKKFGAWG